MADEQKKRKAIHFNVTDEEYFSIKSQALVWDMSVKQMFLNALVKYAAMIKAEENAIDKMKKSK